VQPSTDDTRLLAALASDGSWTFIVVNRSTSLQQFDITVPWVDTATVTLEQYIYSSAAPLAVDGNGFPVPTTSFQAVLNRGFTVSVAAGAVLFLKQQSSVQSTIFPVTRSVLQKRR
jgi:hypothetical protein